MPNRRPVHIDVVSDVVCPWCFIGKHRLEKAIELTPDIPVEVRWRPYFLNDWIPREGISREQYLTTKFGSSERYKRIAQRARCASVDPLGRGRRQGSGDEAEADGSLLHRRRRPDRPQGPGAGRCRYRPECRGD